MQICPSGRSEQRVRTCGSHSRRLSYVVRRPRARLFGLKRAVGAAGQCTLFPLSGQPYIDYWEAHCGLNGFPARARETPALN